MVELEKVTGFSAKQVAALIMAMATINFGTEPLLRTMAPPRADPWTAQQEKVSELEMERWVIDLITDHAEHAQVPPTAVKTKLNRIENWIKLQDENYQEEPYTIVQ